MILISPGRALSLQLLMGPREAAVKPDEALLTTDIRCYLSDLPCLLACYLYLPYLVQNIEIACLVYNHYLFYSPNRESSVSPVMLSLIMRSIRQRFVTFHFPTSSNKSKYSSKIRRAEL